MMTQATMGLRVDVDTSVGLLKGVPRILDILDNYGAQATFFVVMGPDTMGHHIKRFRHRDYWKRIWKVNPLKLVKNYGLTPFFYGTLLPSPKVGEGHPKLIEEILKRGHEVGIHSYNHARWADNFENLSEGDIRSDLDTCIEIYSEITGISPKSSAAPNWRCNWQILGVEEEYGFSYLSDFRGYTPFFPQHSF